MKVIRAIVLKIYMVWVLLVFTLFMLIILPVMVLPGLFGQKYGNITYFGLWLWSWIFSLLTFIRYEVIGAENVDKKTSYIYASNHTSFLDLPGLRIAIPTQFRPLAKKELLKIPVFGLIVRVACVVVDRTNA
ncbi:MAG: 1-acyl-sn-glycerol-3-phosphate acyltransferase, partial [Cytophagales bacterium]|nr:1-acyl-sn-glycerol-3-phosphate acyltransferase [Cytophagales bacterium]